MAKKISKKSVQKIPNKDEMQSPLNLKPLVFAALFAALLAAVAPFKIPLGFTPVPITLQTIVVLLSGAMLGPYYGALSMLLYITVGALGLPVFAGGSSGIGALLGPTGGYLFSYFIAAFAIGKIIQLRKSNRFIDYVVAMFAGTVIIYVLGAAQGMLVTGLGLSAILIGWVLPFIIGDFVKMLLAAYIASKVDIKRFMR